MTTTTTPMLSLSDIAIPLNDLEAINKFLDEGKVENLHQRGVGFVLRNLNWMNDTDQNEVGDDLLATYHHLANTVGVEEANAWHMSVEFAARVIHRLLLGDSSL